MMQSIFTFQPIYKERPWGGEAIAGVGNRSDFPQGKKIGESWEISDREGNESVISEGEFKGKSLRWLLDNHGSSVMGKEWPKSKRFPLLIKILDAQERLSLQVHPPQSIAKELNGEPKTEAWYLLDTQPGAALLAGLKKGVDREKFEQSIQNQTLEPLIHRMSVQKGDLMFIPSGRIHAIDAGCLILEVQQNSDTTYRVYDWGRLGLDGKPRQLHVEESLKSVDFNDFEPSLVSKKEDPWIKNDYFKMKGIFVDKQMRFLASSASILFVKNGALEVTTDQEKARIKQGTSVLLSSGKTYLMRPASNDSEVILTECS
jgi:mannose-6-phosphate isomerase